MEQTRIPTTSMAGRVYGLVLAAILSAVPGLASADSSFRGFTISDTFQQVQKMAKAEGFELKVLDPIFVTDDKQKLVRLRLNNETCASMTFGIKRTITQMDLYPCFYDGQDLALQQVVSEFVGRFGGKPQIDVYRGKSCTDAHPLIYRGKTSEGELFEIFQDCGVAIRIKPGANVQF